MKGRGEQFDDFSNWTFDIDEMSAAAYQITAIHDQGYGYEKTGLEADKAVGGG
jgi:hypothetical protein